VDGPAGRLRVDEEGWLTGVRRLPSPNCDDRPPDTPIDLLVVHAISLPPGIYGGDYIDEFFTNRLHADAHPYFRTIETLRVSAHVVIKREGEVIQYVPFHRRAWHAGVSDFQGRRSCNDFSIGIELEGWDRDPYEHVQYQILAELIGTLSVHWPGIRPERVVGHSDIASGRKTDPGPAFEWRRLRTLLSIYMS
jgi:N-acetyl-anhydromuramoyl-L-alanine amidase